MADTQLPKDLTMYAAITGVAAYLPESVLSNADLERQFPEWSVQKIANKTGISERRIAGPQQFSSDLATEAANNLFTAFNIDRTTVEFIILCTQSPDFYLPTTACLVQEMLEIPQTCGALDINLGCSGYVYALGLAKGLIESGQVQNVLLLTADTYSKFLNNSDKSVRTIFGDGASATFIEATAENPSITGLNFGTDGSGAKHLIVPNGGLRSGVDIAPKSLSTDRGFDSEELDLYMDGPEIFNFTIRVVPESIDKILAKASLSIEEIDLFVFHQANTFMLNHLRKSLGIPEEKFFISLENTGNTVSSTIPIALSAALEQGVLHPKMKVLVLGFGVGLSWGGAVVNWQ